MFSKTFLAAAFAAVVAAQNSNPTITPDVNEVVPGCKPYTLAWTPTSEGTVSIEIISGASQGTLVPVGQVASGIANTGSFVWTPAASLGENAVTGYKIFIDGSPTGEFQYSKPFSVDGTTCSEEPTPEEPEEPTKGETYPTASETKETSYPTETPVVPTSSVCTTTSTVYVNPPTTGYPTAPAQNTTAPYPVNPPTTLYPTAPLPTGTGSVGYPTATPTPPAQEFPGAASATKAGLGLIGAAAAFIFML